MGSHRHIPEFLPQMLDALRQTVPERSGSWTISRMKKSYQAKFLVLGKIRCSYWFPPVFSIFRSNMEQHVVFYFLTKFLFNIDKKMLPRIS